MALQKYSPQLAQAYKLLISEGDGKRAERGDEWFENVELRRQVLIGLNKGEGRNALARAVFFYRRGTVHDRSEMDQQQRAQGLNLVVAAIILWNTLEMERIVTELRRAGTPMTDEQLAHLSPMEWEHSTLTGEYHWKALARPTRGTGR